MEAPPHEQTIAGHRVLVLDETGSTNAVARELAASGRLEEGDAVWALRQTAGRGRRGRTWVTAPGRSLAVSVLIAPPPLPRPAALGLLAAVAACRALESRGAPPLRIKWPNDLMRGERKVGGLLLEPIEGGRRVVLGLGVNLALADGDLSPELAELAGDVQLPADDEARRRHLAALLAALDDALEETGPDAPWRAEYRARAWLPGRRVDLVHDGRPLGVVVVDVSADGDLLLDDGRTLAGEHVELLRVHRAGPPDRAAAR